MAAATRTQHGEALLPGVNVDPIDVAAGLRMMVKLGYDGLRHHMEVEYNLMRWARGEEGAADHSMSESMSGVGYTDWRVIVAAAMAGGRAALESAGNASGGAK